VQQDAVIVTDIKSRLVDANRAGASDLHVLQEIFDRGVHERSGRARGLKE
jgi:hypothetical protein